MSLALWIAIAAFNIPIVFVALRVPFLVSMRQALLDKGPAGPIESTSYSRITGLFGAVVLTTFFWAMGNLILWRVGTATDQDAEAMIDGVWKFFLIGSALFLPYAFNQLRSIFLDRLRAQAAADAAETSPAQLAKGVARPGDPNIQMLKIL